MQNRGTKLFSPCLERSSSEATALSQELTATFMRAGLRPEPAFAAIRAAAIECQNWFLAERPAGQLPDGLRHESVVWGMGSR